MYRQTGPSKGNRRAPVAAPGSPRPTAQRGGGGNKAAGSPAPTAESSTVATVSPTGAVSGGSSAAVAAAKASKRRATRAKRSATREERQKAAAALAQVAALHGKRIRERANPTSPKPSSYLGRKTAAAPTKVELDRAHASGTLKVNKAGAVTTPSVRQASKQVRQAQAALASAQPHITGLRNQAQTEFAEELSKLTRIPPKLAGEWVLQESGASAAGAGGEAGEQNELGVGYPAHPTSFSQSPYFNNTTPKKAAAATAKWMEGKLGADFDYQAASSIQQIPRLAKSGASEEEIRSYIEGPSAWGTGTIAQSGVSAVPGAGAKKAARRVAAAAKEAKSLGLKPKAPSSGRKLSPETIKVRNLSKKVASLAIVKQNKAGTIRLAGGSVVITDTSDGPAEVRKGLEPQITARLLMLSAKVGKPVYTISAARTPQHSEEVGGFRDDPHTKGEAQDIGVGAPTLASAAAIPESVYESVGLYRPFGTAQGGSSTEDNHVQIKPGAPGAVTVTPTTAASVAGAVAVSSSGAVPAGAITAYAKATGQTPAQVRRQLKGKNRAKLLTTLQRYNRSKRKLRSVGAPLSSSSRSRRAESHPILEELKAKYGSAPTSTKQKAAEAAEAK